MAVKYEPVVTLGNLLTAVTIALAGISGWTTISREVERTGARIDNVVSENARQDGEIRDVRKDIQDQMRELRVDIKELTMTIGRNQINVAASGKR